MPKVEGLRVRMELLVVLLDNDQRKLQAAPLLVSQAIVPVSQDIQLELPQKPSVSRSPWEKSDLL